MSKGIKVALWWFLGLFCTFVVFSIGVSVGQRQKSAQLPAADAATGDCYAAMVTKFDTLDQRKAAIAKACVGLPREKQETAATMAAMSPGFTPLPPPAKKHNYDMRDGLLYGYTKVISQNQRQDGQIAPELLMAYFAGRRGDKVQVHSPNKLGTLVMECEMPCEYLKVTSYFDNPYLRGKDEPERIKMVEGTIGWAILSDAIAGRLEVFSKDINGVPHSAWFDPSTGVRFTPAAARGKGS